MKRIVFGAAFALALFLSGSVAKAHGYGHFSYHGGSAYSYSLVVPFVSTYQVPVVAPVVAPVVVAPVQAECVAPVAVAPVVAQPYAAGVVAPVVAETYGYSSPVVVRERFYAHRAAIVVNKVVKAPVRARFIKR